MLGGAGLSVPSSSRPTLLQPFDRVDGVAVGAGAEVTVGVDGLVAELADGSTGGADFEAFFGEVLDLRYGSFEDQGGYVGLIFDIVIPETEDRVLFVELDGLLTELELDDGGLGARVFLAGGGGLLGLVEHADCPFEMEAQLQELLFFKPDDGGARIRTQEEPESTFAGLADGLGDEGGYEPHILGGFGHGDLRLLVAAL